MPRNPGQAASVAEDEKPGTWYVVKADSPEPAFSHQRQSLAGGFGCTPRGACPNCPVQALGHGSWEQAMGLLAAAGVVPAKVEVPDVRVSPALTRRSGALARLPVTAR
jgi:hypothetical protein